VRFSLLGGLLLLGCLPAIPQRTVQLSPLPSAPSTVQACHTVGEQRDRPLMMGLSGGGFETWRQVIATVVIRHPAGLTVLDPDFGYEVARDIADAPAPQRYLLMGDPRNKVPLAERLEQLGIAPRQVRFALITHSHWDHVGAVRDLPVARLRLPAQEWSSIQGIRKRYQQGSIRRQFDGLARRVEPFEFDGPPYQGFPASHDLFGDGSVVAVPMPGHTGGSTGYFVYTPQQRLLFVGDTTWTVEGYRRPAHKMPVASLLVDADREELGEMLGLLNALHRADPELVIVPAHDLAAMEKLPLCQPPEPVDAEEAPDGAAQPAAAP